MHAITTAHACFRAQRHVHSVYLLCRYVLSQFANSSEIAIEDTFDQHVPIAHDITTLAQKILLSGMYNRVLQPGRRSLRDNCNGPRC